MGIKGSCEVYFLGCSFMLHVSLCNPCAVKKGDRVAQLILERIMTPDVEEVDELESTVRGSGGYGSTGVAK